MVTKDIGQTIERIMLKERTSDISSECTDCLHIEKYINTSSLMCSLIVGIYSLKCNFVIVQIS
jgi:hypothetical protein